jgi:1-deoxy-D-xylulose-5-phosphate reductoisomerase
VSDQVLAKESENIDIILHTDMIARQIAEKHIVDIGG